MDILDKYLNLDEIDRKLEVAEFSFFEKFQNSIMSLLLKIMYILLKMIMD